MEINKNTVQNLYRGLGYEYYTASKLWQMGLEAYKMDADFGFDIFAFNQREKTFDEALEKKYFFQVKTRIITDFKSEKGSAGLRKTATTEFYIKKEDFDRLLKEPNAILVCYLVDGTKEIRKHVGEFWLDNNYLKKLNETNEVFFERPEDNKITFKIMYQSTADMKERLISKLSIIFSEVDSVKQKRLHRQLQTLNSLIENASVENLNSHTNLYLIKKNGSKELIKTKYTTFENCFA